MPHLNILGLFFIVYFFCTITQAQNISNPDFEKEIESLIDVSIPLISCQQLMHKMQDNNIYLLDTREAKEFEVSHLKNAKRVGYDHFKLSKIDDIPKNARIVVYCSVGYRSEKVGEKLKAAGYQHVYNLHGGIFEWTNQSLPLYDENGPTNNIHPYDKSWGKWLTKGQQKIRK